MFGKKKQIEPEKKNTLQVISEYIQALFGAVLLAILIRGFVFEPFKIPSESMVPTLLVGDHIFVARYQYGLRVPFTKIWIKEFKDPVRGDVVVFNYPEDEDVDFIKRVVGVPGDVVAIKDGVLTVNDKAVKLEEFKPGIQSKENKCTMDPDTLAATSLPQEFQRFPFYIKHKKFTQKVETFNNDQQHMIQRSLQHPIEHEFEVTIPEKNFFVMGDNRDQSQDSRFWGMVPRENLKGKAIYIWLSLNNERLRCEYNLMEPGVIPSIRWDRFGREII